jgi:hypothetical protein
MNRAPLAIALLFSGLLAGGNVDRALVAMPAWQVVGAAGWADFSRHADLGHGLALYPIEAFGGALFALAAAIGFQFERDAPSSVRILLYVSVVLAAGGLLLTLEAAPIMLGIRDVTDPAALAHAFEGFWFWGNLRAICQVLAFIAQLAALAIWLRREPEWDC